MVRRSTFGWHFSLLNVTIDCRLLPNFSKRLKYLLMRKLLLNSSSSVFIYVAVFDSNVFIKEIMFFIWFRNISWKLDFLRKCEWRFQTADFIDQSESLKYEVDVATVSSSWEKLCDEKLILSASGKTIKHAEIALFLKVLVHFGLGGPILSRLGGSPRGNLETSGFFL